MPPRPSAAHRLLILKATSVDGGQALPDAVATLVHDVAALRRRQVSGCQTSTHALWAMCGRGGGHLQDKASADTMDARARVCQGFSSRARFLARAQAAEVFDRLGPPFRVQL